MDNIKQRRLKGLLNRNIVQAQFFIILSCPSLLWALEKEAENSFQQGIQSFKSGNYQVAERFFLEAKKQGYTSPQVDYNLGVSSFKQKKFSEAIGHFEQLTSHPELSSVAHYNIGLSLEQQNKTSQAQKYFELAANNNTNEKIRYLAQKKLAEKEESPSKKKKKNWSIYSSITYGYDDNVELIERDSASNQEDSYIQSYARARYKTPLDARIYLSIFDINYRDFDEEDYQTIKAGVDYPFRLNDWKMTPAIEYSESELGDDDYQKITDYRFKARKKIGDDSLTLSYRYSDIDAAERQYEYVEGDRHRFRVNYRMPVEIGVLRLRYQYETNNRKDTLTRSYSPDRNTLEAKLTHALRKNWEVSIDGGYRNSDYPRANGINRDDERYQLGFGTEYTVNKTWSISAKYEYTDNKSNQSLEEYRRNVYQLSLDGRF
ncbi:MAG: outer membrane beta-barrel protein [Gammaproteobacteria bacterium]|nr:outer membrane beta-barrel protein [Gammaproteobacteria bacterium]